MEVGSQIHVPTALNARKNPRHRIRGRAGPRAGLDGFILWTYSVPSRSFSPPPKKKPSLTRPFLDFPFKGDVMSELKEKYASRIFFQAELQATIIPIRKWFGKGAENTAV